MSSKTIVVMEDDTDGSAASETVEFAIDGVTYTIDLSDKNAQKLRDGLEKYIAAARQSGGSKRTTRRRVAATNVDLKAVRAWAASRGLKVSGRGRVSADIVNQFRAAGN